MQPAPACVLAILLLACSWPLASAQASSAAAGTPLKAGYYLLLPAVRQTCAGPDASTFTQLAAACGGPGQTSGIGQMGSVAEGQVWRLTPSRGGRWVLTTAAATAQCAGGASLLPSPVCGSPPLASSQATAPWILTRLPGTDTFTIAAARVPAGCAARFLGASTPRCGDRRLTMFTRNDGSRRMVWRLKPVAAPKPQPKPTCGSRSVGAALRATWPRHAELQAAVGVVARQVPALSSARYDMAAPLNSVMLQWERAQGLRIQQTRPIGALWTARNKTALAAFVRKLLVKKNPGDTSCPSVLPLNSMRALKAQLRGGGSAAGGSFRRLMQAPPAASSNGAWGPIFTSGGGAASNNTGAVGTGYNILKAGPNAFSSSNTGVDQGLTFASIFSTNLPLSYSGGLSDSFACTSVQDSSNSAQGTQKATSAQLGASGSYDGVTASANAGFTSNMNQQTQQGASATIYQCDTTYAKYSLGDYGAFGPEVLDSTFYADTVSLIQTMVSLGFNFNLPQVQARLAAYVSAYGTHFLLSAYSGGVASQVCIMSQYGFQYAQNSGFSFSANLASGADSLGGSGNSSKSTSSQFAEIGATCTYFQSPGSVELPVNNGQPDLAGWLQATITAGMLQPSDYRLQNITQLFAFPNLWDNQFNNSVLLQTATIFQQYVLSCSPGSGYSCASYSPNCADQTYSSGGQCKSCYTTGPHCFFNATTSQNFGSCTASTCNCNSPWVGGTCSTYNIGTCYADRTGVHECSSYQSCCNDGFEPDPQWVSGNDQCGCQCSPTQGTINGYSQGAGCGTTPGALCGSCNKCIDNQSCP